MKRRPSDCVWQKVIRNIQICPGFWPTLDSLQAPPFRLLHWSEAVTVLSARHASTSFYTEDGCLLNSDVTTGRWGFPVLFSITAGLFTVGIVFTCALFSHSLHSVLSFLFSFVASFNCYFVFFLFLSRCIIGSCPLYGCTIIQERFAILLSILSVIVSWAFFDL